MLDRLVGENQASERGKKGEAGVGIENIEQTGEDSFDVSLTDGRKSTLSIPRGKDGVDGVPGAQGDQGPAGPIGKRGPAGAPGLDGAPGRNGLDGAGIDSAVINSSGRLIVGLTDGQVIDAGSAQGPEGARGERGSVGLPGSDGADGSSIRSGFGAPNGQDGNDGDFWIDLSSPSLNLYGPKNSGAWSQSAVMLRLSNPEADEKTRRNQHSAMAAGTGGASASVTVTAPITNAGSATSAVIGIPAASDTADGYMSSADKTKLDGLTPGGGTTIIGTAPIDATTGAGGAVDISITAATTSAAGSMSAADKTKLDGLGPVTTPDLQLVTDEGNITTREIKVEAVTSGTYLRAGNPLGNPNWEVTEQGNQASKGNIFFDVDRTASVYSIGTTSPRLDLGTAIATTSLGPSISIRSGSNTHLLDQHVCLDRNGSQFIDCFGSTNKSTVIRATDTDQSSLINILSIAGGGIGLNLQRDIQQSLGNASYSSASDQYLQGWGAATKAIGIRMGTTSAADLIDKILVRNTGISYFGPSIVWDQNGSFENLRIDDDGTLWGRSTYTPTVDRQLATKKYVDDTVANSVYATEDPHVLKNLHFDDEDAEQIITFGGHLNKKLILKSGSPQIPDAQHTTLLSYEGDKVKYMVRPMYYRPTHWGDTTSGDDWTILGRLSNGGADNDKMLTVHRGIGGDSVRYTGRKDDSVNALATQSDITALKSGFVVNKDSSSDVVFDFSSFHTHGQKVFKFKTNKNGESAYVTFGSTDQYWNYDWSYTTNESFRWLCNGNVNFHIDKTGPASTDYKIVDFIDQTSETAPCTTNEISLKDKITEYDAKLTGIKNAVNNATDFDSLKAALLAALI